jgi:hypothetical protein
MQQTLAVLSRNRILGRPEIEQGLAFFEDTGMWSGGKELVELSREAARVHELLRNPRM